MIRPNKPIRLMEWGEGTSTVNQNWNQFAEGTITASKQHDGVTTLVIEAKGSVAKKNSKDDSVKLVQPGEGMTSRSDKWGEVAMGNIKSISQAGSTTLITIVITLAAKIIKSTVV